MIRRLYRLDWIIITAIGILIGFGFFLIYPLSPELAKHQVTFSVIGLLMILSFSNLDYRLLKSLTGIIYLGSIGLLSALILFGGEVRGSTRWFEVAGLQFQPSEFLKPFIILSFAGFLDRFDVTRLKDIGLLSSLAALPIGLIYLQPDLGNAVIYLIVFIIMAVLAGLPLRYLAVGGLAVLLILPSAWVVMEDYQRQRVITFINPEEDPLGSGYHTIQSLIAVGSGNVLGKGIGRGTQSRLRFLPERHNDFIFATLAEEMGFIGVNIIYGVFVILLRRMIKVVERAENRFGSLTASGIVSILLIQMFINSGMNMGMLPITGVTFPFLSYGGSSLLGSMIGVGLIQSVVVFRNDALSPPGR